jgi:autotransporter-associated beta strand protein
MAMAANGGLPVRLAGGGDLEHLHSSLANGVMLANLGVATARRAYQNVEMAMLIDIGWNQFFWKSASGNWADNVSSLTNARWTNIDGKDTLCPVGTITPNLVLRFGGAGGYTSTNNLNLDATDDRFLVNRVILNATAGTSTIAASGAHTLKFDTTIGITPLIRQDGAGAFNITHPIELTPSNLQLNGAGTGRVTLGGAISGSGALIKLGPSTYELAGTVANTYTGTTTVSGGVLILNKAEGLDAVPGNLTIATGGTVRLAQDDQIQGDGTSGMKVTLSGGTLSTGSTTGFHDIVGSFEMTANSTIDLGTGPHALRFTGINGTPTNALTVLDWNGFNGGRLYFADIGTTPNSTYSSFLNAVFFQSFGNRAVFAATPESGVYELVPVPEPATVLAVAFAAVGARAFLRRVRRHSRLTT